MPKSVSVLNCPNCGAAVAPDALSCGYCGSTVATRMCTKCFSRVSFRMKHCPGCGAAVADIPFGGGDPLLCPRCGIGMILLAPAGMQSCPGCAGLWAARDTFQRICAREEEQEAALGFHPESTTAQGAPARKPRRVYVPCPECGKLMNRKNFSGSGVVLDWCRDHGIWFDRSELQKIIAFIRGGGLRKAREREQIQLEERERQVRMKEAVLNSRLESGLTGTMELESKSDPILQAFCRMFLK